MSRINQLIRSLADSYPSYRANPDTLAIYAAKLSVFPVEDVADACNRIVETNKFFPTIAELIELTSGMAYNKDQRHPERRYRKITRDKITDWDDASMKIMVEKEYKSVDQFTPEDIDRVNAEVSL